MKIDIWSDVVCPFCYIGRTRLGQALEGFEHADKVEIAWHSFELDPTTPAGENTPMTELIAKKYGMSSEQLAQQMSAMEQNAASVGLTFNHGDALNANTFDAHRLVHLAGATSREAADTLELALMRAYFTDGRPVDDHAVLKELALAAGLNEAEIDEVLSGDLYADLVRADQQAAAQLGISAVPFFVFAEKFAVAGAQPQEVFEQALTKAWEYSNPNPFQMVVGEGAPSNGPVCGPDGCEVPQHTNH